eukprot:282438-Chlamydomonas_euryale.AAC.1
MVGGAALPRDRRVSLTLRKVRGFACNCEYPESCDSQSAPLQPTRLALKQQCQPQPQRLPLPQQQPPQQQQPQAALPTPLLHLVDATANGVRVSKAVPGITSNQDSASSALEHTHVVQVYDAIAQHFSATRCGCWVDAHPGNLHWWGSSCSTCGRLTADVFSRGSLLHSARCS